MNFFARWRLRKPADGPDSVYVTERLGVRSLHIGSDTIQSSMRLARPHDLELAYTRSMMAFLLFTGCLRRVLMVGLGGGSLAPPTDELPDALDEVLQSVSGQSRDRHRARLVEEVSTLGEAIDFVEDNEPRDPV